MRMWSRDPCLQSYSRVPNTRGALNKLGGWEPFKETNKRGGLNKWGVYLISLRIKLKNFQTGGSKRVYPDIFIAFFNYNSCQFLKSRRAIAPSYPGHTPLHAWEHNSIIMDDFILPRVKHVITRAKPFRSNC